MRCVILLAWFCGTFSSMVWANALKDIRVWPAPDETRVVIDMESTPVYKYFTLTKPDRLVVDLMETDVDIRLPLKINDSQILNNVRKSTPPNNQAYRLVFELKGKSSPKIFPLPPIGDSGHRLVIDIPHQSGVHTLSVDTQKKAQPVVKPKANPARDKSDSDTFISAPFGTDDIVIAIDPGHGGYDPGALGPKQRGKKQNYEKNVTLPISKIVAEKLNAINGIKAVLTRTGDYYVDLNKRSDIARKHGAHLLVSIHADGFIKPQPSGASVWVLSHGRAQSEMGRWMERHEEQSNLLGGGGILLENNQDQHLSRAVLDLLKQNSQKEGYDVAESVLKELKKVTKLHKSEPADASLAVLKSPDIPSLLVEAGFMSNPAEEKLLLTARHQRRIANAVYVGILNYFRNAPPDGTLLAAEKYGVKHTVLSGQSLSTIAKKYGVSAAKIKTDNRLSSAELSQGQVLTIKGMKADRLLRLSSKGKKRAVAEVSPRMITHTVKSGDSLSMIAEQYDVSVSSIQKNNRLRSTTLFVGQQLKIYDADLKTVKHQVKSGEYLGKIANNYGVSVDSIRKVNKLRTDELAIGQTLIIPGS